MKKQNIFIFKKNKFKYFFKVSLIQIQNKFKNLSNINGLMLFNFLFIKNQNKNKKLNIFF